jgi:hypothetical protein
MQIRQGMIRTLLTLALFSRSLASAHAQEDLCKELETLAPIEYKAVEADSDAAEKVRIKHKEAADAATALINDLLNSMTPDTRDRLTKAFDHPKKDYVQLHTFLMEKVAEIKKKEWAGCNSKTSTWFTMKTNVGFPRVNCEPKSRPQKDEPNYLRKMTDGHYMEKGVFIVVVDATIRACNKFGAIQACAIMPLRGPKAFKEMIPREVYLDSFPKGSPNAFPSAEEFTAAQKSKVGCKDIPIEAAQSAGYEKVCKDITLDPSALPKTTFPAL